MNNQPGRPTQTRPQRQQQQPQRPPTQDRNQPRNAGNFLQRGRSYADATSGQRSAIEAQSQAVESPYPQCIPNPLPLGHPPPVYPTAPYMRSVRTAEPLRQNSNSYGPSFQSPALQPSVAVPAAPPVSSSYQPGILDGNRNAAQTTPATARSDPTDNSFLSMAQFRAHSAETRSEIREVKDMFFQLLQHLNIGIQRPS